MYEFDQKKELKAVYKREANIHAMWMLRRELKNNRGEWAMAALSLLTLWLVT